MRTYQSKDELILEIKTRYEKYDIEFDDIVESMKDLSIDGIDKTPAENLSYQLGWIGLLLDWEAKEKAGKFVQTPTPEYKWNNLGGLYKSFYETYESMTLSEKRHELRKRVELLCQWINTLTDEELFQPMQRKWATTAAMWPVYKWVHINTVAPFTNFRTQIRKWKKLSTL